MSIATPSNADEWRIHLQSMSIQEKIDLMSLVWDDLAQQPQQVPSPAWHGDVLRERQKALAEGRTEFRDWEVAKQDIRERFQNR